MKNTNCPNCGAVITGPTCEYCGTVFSNHTSEVIQIKIENDLLKQHIRMQQLYEDALNAMRKYTRLF